MEALHAVAAWSHYAASGSAPKRVINAARRASVGLTGSFGVEREKQLREIKERP